MQRTPASAIALHARFEATPQRFDREMQLDQLQLQRLDCRVGRRVRDLGTDSQPSGWSVPPTYLDGLTILTYSQIANGAHPSTAGHAAMETAVPAAV
jgi:hypothetical protein